MRKLTVFFMFIAWLCCLALNSKPIENPLILSIKNSVENPLFLTSSGEKIDIAALSNFSGLFSMNDSADKWKAQYSSGNLGKLLWKYDQSLAADIKNCHEQFKRKYPEKTDDLYICNLSFDRDKTGIVGSTFKFAIDSVEAVGLNRASFAKQYNDFYAHLFPSEITPTKTYLASLDELSKELSKVRTKSKLLDKLAADIVAVKTAYEQQKEPTHNILVLGDQGTGKQVAKDVARSMFAVCNLKRCDYAISAGDNIYPRGPSIDDNNWQDEFVDKFVNVYKDLWDRFAFPFYLTLGNHDVGIEDFFAGDWVWSFQKPYGTEHFLTKRIPLIKAQEKFTTDTANPVKGSAKMWNLDNDYYSKVIDKNGLKTFILALNTNYFPGSLDKNNTPYNEDQQAWLKAQLLSEPAKNADWRIVFAHHPIYSAGRHGVNIGKGIGRNDYKAMLELRAILEPMLCSNKVDFYIVGHDHHLEFDLIPCPGNQKVAQILSGAASKAETIKWHEVSPSETIFGADAFSKTLAQQMPTLVWANGLARQEIIDGKSVQKMNGFSFLKLYKDHAVFDMIENTSAGPKWLACWRLNKVDGKVTDQMTSGCEHNLSNIFAR